MVDRVGQQLGNYRLSCLIGHGGFAEVYLGEHIHLNTQAAIKVLQMQLPASNLEQFRNEARTIASLVHPNIVRVLDFGVEEGIPFLVMDYALNGTLRQRHPKGSRLAPATIVPYVKQVAAALQYAHDGRLIHRDVKPENMLVGRNEEVLLSDFGLVMIAQSTSSQTIKEMVGTLPYMAPEQINGKPRPASDQYAMGIVIYEWLSGEHPFHGSLVEIATQHLMTPPAPLHEKVAEISPAVEEVVFTALAKDPQQRFASVHTFATAFEQACQMPPSASFVPRSIVSRLSATSGTTGMVTSPTYPLAPAVELAPPGQPLTAPTYVSPKEPPPTPFRRRRQLRWLIAAVIIAAIIATIAALAFTLPPGTPKSIHNAATTSLLSTRSSSPATPTPVPSKPTATPRPPSVNPSTLNFNLTQLGGSLTKQLKLSSGSQAESWSAQTGGLPWLNLDVMSGTLNSGQTRLINVTVDPTTLVPGTYTGKITINLSSGGALTVPVTLTVL